MVLSRARSTTAPARRSLLNSATPTTCNTFASQWIGVSTEEIHTTHSHNIMSTILRTLGNVRRIGVKEYLHQMLYIGDTKAGVLVGQDRFGNKYYENLEEELPLRTRWVDYKVYELDASQIDPGWHAWMSYLVDKPPSEDSNLQFGRRPWDSKEAKPNYTQSWGAYRPFSTCAMLQLLNTHVCICSKANKQQDKTQIPLMDARGQGSKPDFFSMT
ncbi:hypothetical protein DV736_g504, partial [Chaetothyriales sp. CBS 134916]